MSDLNGVQQVPPPAISEDVQTQMPNGSAPASDPTVTQAPSQPVPGSKTPAENLLAALQEEREMRKRAEAEKKDLEDKLNQSNAERSFETGQQDVAAIKEEVVTLQNKLSSIEEQRELDTLITSRPELREHLEAFNEYRKDYPRHKLENVAKLFMVEKGLSIGTPPRQGLETPTGGDRTPAKSKLSSEEIKKLRETDFRKYLSLVVSGQIDPTSIS